MESPTEFLRLLVKDYFDHCGITDACFKNNTPGPDWMLNFIKRHKLTSRLADNVKPCRAEVGTAETLCRYFDELEQVGNNQCSISEFV